MTWLTQEAGEALVLGDESPLVALVRRNEDLRRQIRANERKIARLALRQHALAQERQGGKT